MGGGGGQERRRVALNSRSAVLMGMHREEALARFANHEVRRGERGEGGGRGGDKEC